MAKPLKIESFIGKVNIAEDLDEEKLIEIGNDAYEGYKADKKSRADWEKNVEEWTQLALQVCKTKTFPWQGASNVKYPLIATASMQFSARAYPSLIPSNGEVVKCKVIGADPQGEKANRAKRVSRFMSYQIMEEMEEWEEEMDKLLLYMAIVGIGFKKTYFCPDEQRNVSIFIPATDLVVNYYAKSLEKADRISQIYWYPKRKVREFVNQKLWLDVELGEPQGDTEAEVPTEIDSATPYRFIEQHTYLDLDDDGYPEPYIVTFEHASKQVVRITACYSADTVTIDQEGKIVSIKPISYYTKYGAIPNPDGSIYDIGFGRLLGPINESVNTLINQLIDAGTLSNLQSGFLGKGLRMKMGDTKFKPGEWKVVNATGNDLKQQIFPMPVREPSNVLFQLLGMLIQSGKELASVADIMVGKMPGQNTPAYTTKETVEQGMKVFTAIYKRVFRSMKSEFRKLYMLNKTYISPEVYADILDEQVQDSDFNGPEKDIIPAADPGAASRTDKGAKVQEMFPLVQLGTLNPMELTKRALEAQEQPNMEALLMQPQPKADPKAEAMQQKAQIDQQKAQQDMQLKQFEAALKEREKQLDLRIKQMEAQMKMQLQQQEHYMKLSQADENHMQRLSQGADMFQLKAIEMAEEAKRKAEPQAREPKQPKK